MEKTSRNLLESFQNSVNLRKNATCFRYKQNGWWRTLSWIEVYNKVLDIAGALKKFGIKKGDRVCIFSKARYEWTLSDLAILANGAITVPIYESSLPEQAEYIIKNCGARALFVDDPLQLKKIKQVQSSLTDLKQIILFENKDGAGKEKGIYTFDELLILGSGLGEPLFKIMLEELNHNSEASYVYTSGTTGPPKGAVLTHGNFVSEVVALRQILPFTEKTESLIFLPLAHILARVVQFSQIEIGYIQNYAESIDKLLDNLLEVRPHIMASVPRIFEKVHTRVMQGVESSSDIKKRIFRWALKVGEERASFVRRYKSVPLAIKLKWAVAFKLVFSKLHAKLGGRIDYFISGGAPLSPEIAEFFLAAGFIILEGYGLTETSAAVCCNQPRAMKIGTVGQVVPGVELKIASDGEILVKGPVVFQGYYGRPEDTKEVLNKDGWFHTGDIGVIDSEGYVKITDRKKDIIVTAAGKNIAPQNIENLIKADPIISQVMIHGDKRKFLSALVTLDKEVVINYAKSHKINFKAYEDLITNEKIYHLIKSRIEEKNKHLAKYETVKKFAILKNDFSIESGELTPTMKVKRKFTSEKYKNILDGFYQE